jgi:hypothetical protein
MLRASQDLLNLFINAPNRYNPKMPAKLFKFSRIAGFYSYILDQTDLLFPKNSGWRMKLYRVDSITALKQKAWNQASETKIGDMIWV